MYSAYKLNKQGHNIQPWRTPFPIWNQSGIPCLVLTVASWPAYRFKSYYIEQLKHYELGSNIMYDQATQDGYFLSLYTSPAWPVPASPITLLKILTFPHTCFLWPQLLIVLIKGVVRGVLLCWFPWQLMTQTVTYNGSLHFPQEQTLPPCPACCSLHTVGCSSLTLLQACKLLHPLNHWGFHPRFFHLKAEQVQAL